MITNDHHLLLSIIIRYHLLSSVDGALDGDCWQKSFSSSSVIIRCHQSSSVIIQLSSVDGTLWRLHQLHQLAPNKISSSARIESFLAQIENCKILNIGVKEVLGWLRSVLYWCTMDAWNVGPSPFCFDFSLIWNIVVNPPQEGKFQARTGTQEPIFYRAWTGHRSDVILTPMSMAK